MAQQQNQPHQNRGGQPRQQSRHLILDLTAPVRDGDASSVTAAAWYKEDNRPRQGVAILFYLDMIDLRSPILTDAEGRAVATIAELEPGPHTITAKVQGWGSGVSKSVIVEGKKETKKEPKKIDSLKITRLRLDRNDTGTRYLVTVQALDENCDPIPYAEIEVSAESDLNRMEKKTTDAAGTVRSTVTVVEPKCRFFAAGGGASQWEWLFHDAHLLKK